MQGGAVVKFGNLLLLAAFAAMPAGAEEIEFEGRTVEIGGDQESPAILRMSGARYGINATSAQILDKARACIGRVDGVSVAAVEAASISGRRVRVRVRDGAGHNQMTSELLIQRDIEELTFFYDELARP